MTIGSAHFIHFVYLKMIGRTGNLPLYECFRNEHCRHGILHYKVVPNCRHLLRYRLYAAFSRVLFLFKDCVLSSPFLQVAFADDGFRVEVNGSLPSSARQIQSIREIADAWIRVVAQTPLLCPENSFLSTIPPHHFIN